MTENKLPESGEPKASQVQTYLPVGIIISAAVLAREAITLASVNAIARFSP